MTQSQVDTWSTREQLALASAVLSSGDQNWVAVSRGIKSVCSECIRPPDWFSTKNCALQYSKLLEGMAPAKRKRVSDGNMSSNEVNETPGEMLAKILCKQHLDELIVTMDKEKKIFHIYEKELQQLEKGLCDDTLGQLWEEMLKEFAEEAEMKKSFEDWSKKREELITAFQLSVKPYKSPGGFAAQKKGLFGRPAGPSSAAMSLALVKEVSISPSSVNATVAQRDGSESPLLSSLLTRPSPALAPQTPNRVSRTSAVNGAVAEIPGAPSSSSANGLMNSDVTETSPNQDPQALASDSFSDSEEKVDNDTKMAVANGTFAPVVVPKKEALDDSLDTATKQENCDVDSQVIKEDPMLIVNKPDADSQSFEPNTAKEGYECGLPERVVKVEAKDVWDDMKSCGETLQIGEVQRKYNRRPRHSSGIKQEKEDSETDLEECDELEEEEDGSAAQVELGEEDEEDEGFAGFAPSSVSEGIRKMSSVMAVQSAVAMHDDEDVYNIDNDDTIGLKAKSQQHKLRECIMKQSSTDESAEEKMSSPPVDRPTPLLDLDATAEKELTALKALPKKQLRDKLDDKMDFDECDSFDSFTTKSSTCDSDQGGLAGGGGRKRRLLMSYPDLSSPHPQSDYSPDSPVSFIIGDDPESEKVLRQWRKSIMILWNDIASHKYASVFLRPITEDKVPGYLNVVKRPMDLQTIKRNIESGLVRSTEEFQRDIMLMCTNATIYNTIGHNVYYMALDLLSDALAKIEEFQSAAGVIAPESPHKILRRETRESFAKRSEETCRLGKKKKLV